MAGETIIQAAVSSTRAPTPITISGVMNGIGTALILFLMSVMLIDIGGRVVFNRPLAGVPEMVSMAIVAIVFLQLPHSVASRALIASDMLYGALQVKRPKAAAVLSATCSLVGTLVFLAIAYASFRFLAKAWEHEETYGTAGVFEFPQWPLRATIVLGAIWTSFEFLRLAWKDASILRGNP
jgi:TRAP-type mannitol/chloroaromatic compound transport system permease small subunit